MTWRGIRSVVDGALSMAIVGFDVALLAIGYRYDYFMKEHGARRSIVARFFERETQNEKCTTNNDKENFIFLTLWNA